MRQLPLWRYLRNLHLARKDDWRDVLRGETSFHTLQLSEAPKESPKSARLERIATRRGHYEQLAEDTNLRQRIFSNDSPQGVLLNVHKTVISYGPVHSQQFLQFEDIAVDRMIRMLLEYHDQFHHGPRLRISQKVVCTEGSLWRLPGFGISGNIQAVNKASRTLKFENQYFNALTNAGRVGKEQSIVERNTRMVKHLPTSVTNGSSLSRGSKASFVREFCLRAPQCITQLPNRPIIRLHDAIALLYQYHRRAHNFSTYARVLHRHLVRDIDESGIRLYVLVFDESTDVLGMKEFERLHRASSTPTDTTINAISDDDMFPQPITQILAHPTTKEAFSVRMGAEILNRFRTSSHRPQRNCIVIMDTGDQPSVCLVPGRDQSDSSGEDTENTARNALTEFKRTASEGEHGIKSYIPLLEELWCAVQCCSPDLTDTAMTNACLEIRSDDSDAVWSCGQRAFDLKMSVHVKLQNSRLDLHSLAQCNAIQSFDYPVAALRVFFFLNGNDYCYKPRSITAKLILDVCFNAQLMQLMAAFLTRQRVTQTEEVSPNGAHTFTVPSVKFISTVTLTVYASRWVSAETICGWLQQELSFCEYLWKCANSNCDVKKVNLCQDSPLIPHNSLKWHARLIQWYCLYCETDDDAVTEHFAHSLNLYCKLEHPKDPNLSMHILRLAEDCFCSAHGCKIDADLNPKVPKIRLLPLWPNGKPVTAKVLAATLPFLRGCRTRGHCECTACTSFCSFCRGQLPKCTKSVFSACADCRRILQESSMDNEEN